MRKISKSIEAGRQSVTSEKSIKEAPLVFLGSRYKRTQRVKCNYEFPRTRRHRTPPKLQKISKNLVSSTSLESARNNPILGNKEIASSLLTNFIKIEETGHFETSDSFEIDVNRKTLGVLREKLIMNTKADIKCSLPDFELTPNYHPDLRDTAIYQSSLSNSTDSAKGSSIDLEIDSAVKSGDVFWARISPFPYWPCIVWPDQIGRTLILNNNKVQKQNIKVHVRFFGDNGRHSWVHKANLITYNGLVDFEKLKVERLKSLGKKHILYRAFHINSKKKNTWEKAVAEADEVSTYPSECRLEIFENILEKYRERMATEGLRRRRSVSSNPNLFLPENIAIKRERSPDIEDSSDASEFQIKKVKLDSSDIPVMNVCKTEVLSDINLDDNPLFSNDEFEHFYDIIKKYVFKNGQSQFEQILLESVRNIWYIRHLSKTDGNEGGKHIARSNRRLVLDIKELERSNSQKSLKQVVAKNDSKDQNRIIKKKAKSIEEVMNDIMQLSKNYLFKGLVKEPVCKTCRQPTNLIKCSGKCQSLIHVDCNDIIRSPHITGDSEDQKGNLNFKKINTRMCMECSSDKFPICFVCKHNETQLTEILKCYITWCNCYYHPKCLKYWPQSKITKSSSKVENLLCPAHVCHTCVSDDPRGKFLQIDKSRLVRCVDCPATYHSDSFCIPAGAKFLTATQILCPRHGEQEKLHVNVNWCFICVNGGNLICCDTCPTAFHLECLKIPQPDGNYICEECETGRLPLYGELVWAKLGSYRWWPAIIMPPPEIPKNLELKKHHWSEFCIRFFGTNDHAWISRKRVFLYQEGDWGKVPSTKGVINKSYSQGLEEAKIISELLMKKRQQKISSKKERGLVPLPYVKIKSNRPVPPVKLQELDISELTPCECSLYDDDPCGPYSGCLNRLLMTECNPKICPAGSKCQNQLFEKRHYPPLSVCWTKEKGWGLICEQDMKSGTFVIEYVGEVIDEAEFQRRITHKQEEKDENYYFLTLEKDHKIDAGPKGNLARFMNHSCEPNCETQKWTVNGVTRIGLFAIEDVLAKTELTFNYNLESLGDEKKICNCKSNKCSGFIGSKYKEGKIISKINQNSKNENMLKPSLRPHTARITKHV